MVEQEKPKDLHFIISALFVLLMSAGVYYLGGTGLESITGFEVLNASPCPTAVNNDTNLTANISETLLASQACITVNASNIVIDCLGYQLLGNRTGIGINSSGFDNITIRNCLISNFTNNIMLFNSHHNLITNNTLRNATGNGLLINESHNNTIANVTSEAAVSSPLNAILITNSTNNTLFNVTGRNTAFTGIQFARSNNNTMSNSTGISSTSVGVYIYYSHNITLTNNFAASNSNASFFLKRSNATNATGNNGTTVNGSGTASNGFAVYEVHFSTFQNNYARTADLSSFYVFSSTNNFFINNSMNASFYGGMDMEQIYNSTFINNTAHGNNGYVGIYITIGLNNTLIGNLGTSGGNSGINFYILNYSLIRNNNATGTDANGFVFNDVHHSNITDNFGRGVSFAGISLYIGNSNNTFSNNIGVGVNDDGIQLGYDNTASVNNTFINNTGRSTSFSGFGIQNGSGNTFLNSTVESEGTTRFGILLTSTSINNSFNNTDIRTNGTWISTGSLARDNRFSNVNFIRPNGTINTQGNFTVPNATNVTQTFLNITSNNIFLNSTAIDFLNRSALLTLRNINLSDPQPTIDDDDDGTFGFCSEPRCTEISYNNNVFIFNVTSFTTYSSQGTPTAPGQGGRGLSGLGGSTQVSITKPKEEQKCSTEWICNDWGTCTDGTQFRECVDSNSCNDLNSRPAIEKRCSVPNPETPATPSANLVKTELPENFQQNINATSFGLVITIITILLYIYYTKQQ